jgi:hypothetical protein
MRLCHFIARFGRRRPWLEIQILFRTVRSVLAREGAR